MAELPWLPAGVTCHVWKVPPLQARAAVLPL
jgi:hypothetical protein